MLLNMFMTATTPMGASVAFLQIRVSLLADAVLRSSSEQEETRASSLATMSMGRPMPLTARAQRWQRTVPTQQRSVKTLPCSHASNPETQRVHPDTHHILWRSAQRLPAGQILQAPSLTQPHPLLLFTTSQQTPEQGWETPQSHRNPVSSGCASCPTSDPELARPEGERAKGQA